MTESPILVVDDDPAIVSVVSEILDLEGYAVETATNGQEALRVIDRLRPAIVLLDMRMPVMDGWGFARALRERGESVPILVMTAAQNARAWAEEIGAQGYLAKPFEVMDLIEAVERLAGASGQ
ncbi:MAG TPA: response regulator [Chloroflexota bacterium]|nr:response regulator [Chloroflexota bacterium]